MTTIQRPLRYRLVIRTLSPLHIGSGERLHKDFDYVVERKKTWILDNDVISQEIYSVQGADDLFQRLVDGAPAGTLLSREDFQEDSKLFRYVMEGQPSAKIVGAELQAHIKDCWDHPYIPGSSLKGALRTAFLYYAFDTSKQRFRVEDSGDKSPKFAAQQLERQFLGKNPNYDVFRLLAVSDSNALDPKGILRLSNINVFTGGKEQAPIALECIQPDTVFEATLTLDRALMEGIVPNSQILGWEAETIKRLKVIDQIVNKFTFGRITSQKAYWKNYPQMMGFYTQLIRNLSEIEERKQKAFILQLGWGGGWDSKTLGDHLTRDPETFYRLVQKFRALDPQKKFKKGNRYPASRRVLMQKEIPLRPLGWIRVDMERID